jgi:polysaccharide export outer membrane protein
MMRTVDLDRTLKGIHGSELVPLRRFDIIYVPKTGLAEMSNIMTQVRDALPVQFSYAFGSGIIP